MNEFQAAVAGHAVGQFLGGGKVVAFVKGVHGLGFLVADVNESRGNFVAVMVLVGLGAVKEDAAPEASVVLGGGHRVLRFRISASAFGEIRNMAGGG